MTATQHAPVTEVDRVYARAIGLVARGSGEEAVAELVAAAGGNPHVLGAVAERLRALVAEHPNALAADALALANEARLHSLE